MYVLDKFKKVLCDKWKMAMLANDLSTFVRLHRLGRRKMNQTSHRSWRHATALRLRPFEGTTVWCRRGTSDGAALWETIFDSEYFIPHEFVKGVRTVLDLGANVGYSMLYFAKQYPLARIVGVEPDGDNVQVARRNIQSVGLESRCSVIAAAAWHRDTFVALNRSCSEYAFRVQGEAVRCASSVRAYTIGALMRMAGFDAVDLLKVNIEGSERGIFECAKSWADRVSCVICELHEGYTFDDFRSAMRPSGFRCFEPGRRLGLKVPLAVRERGNIDQEPPQ